MIATSNISFSFPISASAGQRGRRAGQKSAVPGLLRIPGSRPLFGAAPKYYYYTTKFEFCHGAGAKTDEKWKRSGHFFAFPAKTRHPL
jgi:hypothetical protein